MRWQAIMTGLLLSCTVLLTGCGGTVLLSDEIVYDVPDRPGYKAVSAGVLAKLVKCCEACLDKEGAKP